MTNGLGGRKLFMLCLFHNPFHPKSKIARTIHCVGEINFKKNCWVPHFSSLHEMLQKVIFKVVNMRGVPYDYCKLVYLINVVV
jgi:hypothetical protein